MEGGARAERIFFIRGAERHPSSESESGSTFFPGFEEIDCFTSMDEIGGVFPIIVFVTLVELNMFGVLVTADDLLGEAFTLDTTGLLLFKIFKSLSELDKLE